MTLIADRYEPVAAPTAGGMGSVVRCKDTVLQRHVAIKFLSPGVDRRRMMDEIIALQAVRSPHVVQMYDFVIVPPDNRIGIVQEFIDGRDLVELTGAGLGAAERLKLLHQIADGLADVHAAGIIHRDIKPNNMKVDAEGVLKIFDFGLAREVGKADTHGFIGTPGFAAPELFQTGFVSFTTAIDVYAFGCTAISLGPTGLPANLSAMPPAPTGGEFSGLGLPPGVAAEMPRCLSVDPSLRPALATLRDLIAKHLVANKHRALITHHGTTYHIDSSKKRVDLTHPSQAVSIRVEYDGLDFTVTAVTGTAFANNIPLTAGYVLAGSCLITLGTGRDRAFVTFDVSHPEVVL